MTIGELVRRWARWTPTRTAVAFGGERVGYAELDERSDRLIAALQARDLRRGDRLATLADNSGRHVEIVAAAAKAGFILVPINPRLTAREAGYLLRDAGVAVLFAGARYETVVAEARADAPDLRAIVQLDGEGPDSYDGLLGAASAPTPPDEIRPDEALLISYTSGTTGAPKGAVMSHRNLLANAQAVAYHFELDATAVNLVVMPQSTGGCNHHIVAPTLFAGGCLAVEDARNFEPARFLAAVERERATHVQLVPTMIYRLLDAPEVGVADSTSLRVIGYGSAPMSTERLREAIARFGPKFCQVYGQTEASSLATCLSRRDHDDLLAAGDLDGLRSSGRPVNTVDLRLVDDGGREVAAGEMGEIALRGDTVTSGYWRAPEATAAAIRDGWLHTGDMGRIDAGGRVHLVDRKKDIIISGAVNISAREVEDVIYRHPGVRECAVIGVPDPHWGESVKAVVTAREGQRIEAEEVLALCRGALASFKLPRSVDVIDEFPKNGMGKILKRELKRQYWGDRASLVN